MDIYCGPFLIIFLFVEIEIAFILIRDLQISSAVFLLSFFYKRLDSPLPSFVLVKSHLSMSSIPTFETCENEKSRYKE